ncbi:precorrin-4 C11-methyltransferase [Methanosalsum zhilinae DSM 4017]|uniref:Precorrin-4 C11-methyltransferase n=1 Tax=Methanosalsum zhilinae (strain DSM 4017 / NBRC 107636 / OCM 62 / WeN5) TaxID=679901 RepID=F7XNA3_METZD|nr:precorrin-4 C(11)-methyltransferase [Methanosalsum zhilinae]AEH60061.1 precorrin-4 C11-methyltransferase [Methanosalsum zhilinae DSM 4017]
MTDRKVYFVGAGPGDPKLITVRGKELLENADLVVYAGSLINPIVLDYSDGKKVDSYGLTLDEITEMMAESVNEGKMVVRLHSGDPSLYGSIVEQMEELKKYEIEVERVPGVSSIFASAAALNTQLTLNGVSDSLIITRPAGKTLEQDLIAEFSRLNSTMAVFLGTQKIEQIMNKVECPKDTPVAVIYHASWDDEKVIRGTVEDIADRVKEAGIKRSAMIIIGGVVDPKNYRRSHLYGVAQDPL